MRLGRILPRQPAQERGGLLLLVRDAHPGMLARGDFTTEDFNALVSTNLLGFLYITQLAVQQMLKQKSGNVVTIRRSPISQSPAYMLWFR
jgi:NADP-dependent 3-hydroxy acid dehydrogenase YdfG